MRLVVGRGVFLFYHLGFVCGGNRKTQRHVREKGPHVFSIRYCGEQPKGSELKARGTEDKGGIWNVIANANDCGRRSEEAGTHTEEDLVRPTTCLCLLPACLPPPHIAIASKRASNNPESLACRATALQTQASVRTSVRSKHRSEIDRSSRCRQVVSSSNKQVQPTV